MRLRALFADTSFFYALLDGRDRDHEAALRLAEAVRRRRIPLLTTWEIVVETVTLLRMRHSYAAALVFVDEILPRLNVLSLTRPPGGGRSKPSAG